MENIMGYCLLWHITKGNVYLRSFYGRKDWKSLTQNWKGAAYCTEYIIKFSNSFTAKNVHKHVEISEPIRAMSHYSLLHLAGIYPQ